MSSITGIYGREVRTQVESLEEAERMAWTLHMLGATVEPDRFIRERCHVLVCAFDSPHRVLVLVRGTVASGVAFDAMWERLAARMAAGG